MGFFEEMLTDGSVRRGETYTCCHCNGVREFKDNMGMFRPPTMCSREHKPLCEPCARAAHRTGKCANWERTMEQVEARDRLLRSCGIK